ncbi:uncharacterized protein PAC_06556 [Phialocephala subalpina]|uniref:Uncharacterized protein n=1 Tax=Phialocephala subalpina TaxID=576137 RepID=A0A1L7WV72_9HELO|nr:uncharacterized protein PAC_06556 [Phialocephala subalpina]
MSFLKAKKSMYKLHQESKLSVTSSTLSHFSSSSGVDPERVKAIALLQGYRSAQGKPKKRNDEFTYEDVNAVLSERLENPQDVSVGLINVLLGFEHDLNYSVRAKEGIGGRFGRKEGQRNNIVQRATENRNCSLGIWTLLIHKADQTTLIEAFDIAVRNNMVAKADICLQIATSRELWLNPLEALVSAVELASQTNAESEYLRLIIVLLKWPNEDVKFKISNATKIAAGAGHSRILQVLSEHSASSQLSSRNHSLQSFPDLQVSQALGGVPQRLYDYGLLEATSRGVPEACREFSDLFRSSESQIPRSSCGALLGEILQQCSGNVEWLPSQTLEVIGHLLSNSSYSPEIDAAFCRTMGYNESARSDGFRDAAELLAHSALQTTFNIVLDNVSLGPNFSDADLWRLNCLIEWGASGESVHLALCQGLYARMHGRGPKSDSFIRTLVGAELDVNHEEGEAFRAAADCGNIEILGQLLAAGPTPETKAFAFAVAILAQHDESLLLALIDLFMSGKSEPLVGKESPPKGYFPPLFMCLQLYPKSRRLVESLIKAGCPVDATIEYNPSEDYLQSTESITPLIFALCAAAGQAGRDQQISSDVIDVLISKGDVNFQTSKSKVTPLILAAKHGRKDVVAKLLKKRAKTSATDIMERSALFYASRNGDLPSVEALLQVGSPADDGSLHEAARELHDDVVKVLIKKGHRINSRSTNEAHGDRTALHEMLQNCNGNAGIPKIKETILALTKGKLDDEDFFLALSNSAPIPLVRALLSISMDEQLRKGELLLESKAGAFIFYYSPMMYIRQSLASSPVEVQNRLLAEIGGLGGQDQFYAQQGMRQPPGYTGAPQPIHQAEENRRAQREMEINTLPRSLQQKRRKEYEKEDKQYAIAQGAALEELQRQAEQKRWSMMADAQLARQRQANLDVLREQQLSMNLKIQQGDAVTRRKYYIASITERRHMSFLRGVDTFSEKERRIAGW